MAQIMRMASSRAELSAVKIPKNGFYEHGLPSKMAAKYWLRTAWLELCLRFRVAGKGLYRGLVEARGILAVCRLHATVLRADGRIEHLGLLSTKLITDAGVAYIVDDWDGGSNTIDLFNFHGVGTGVGAESAGDTALGTETTTQINPDSTRATGTKTQPTAPQARSVGLVTFDGTVAVTEHGIFHQAATGGGTLFDRSVFSAINVVSGDSIQFTHTTTYSSGG